MPASSAACANVSRSSNRVASGRSASSTWSKSPNFMDPRLGRLGRCQGGRSLVNFRLGNLPRAGEEIEVAAFVSLADMSGEHGPIAAQVAWWRRLPSRLATSEFFLADIQMNAARRHVDLDGITGAHERQRPADEALRRHMKNTGAVAGAAHAPVRDPHHVTHARLHQFLGDRKHAPFRHAGPPLGPAFFSTMTWSGVTARSSRSTSRAMWS